MVNMLCSSGGAESKLQHFVIRNGSGITRLISWLGTTGPFDSLIEYLTIILECIDFSIFIGRVPSGIARLSNLAENNLAYNDCFFEYLTVLLELNIFQTQWQGILTVWENLSPAWPTLGDAT